MTQLRLATQHDVAAILAACRWLISKSPAKQMQFAEPVAYECGIRHAIHEERGWIIGGFFIMVDVGRDWFSSHKFLIEQLVLRIEKTEHKVGVAIAALDTLQAHYGCSATMVGDTQVGYMVPHYQAAGFSVHGTQLIKGELSSAGYETSQA